MPKQPQAYTVGAITRMIKSGLEDSFSSVWIEGEVSNYTHHSSGHRYLTLKDERAVIKVVIWRSVGATLKFEPEVGKKVLAYGDITVYEKGGNYQLSCRKMESVGVGALELAFRQLYKKLSLEGLFEDDRKKPLPAFSRKIGIVTSPTGAAIRDIIQISRRRNQSVELVLFPAQVQGDGAEKTIKAGIEYFNTRDDIDVIITGRGGGSLEDLWPFNTEMVVRAIAASQIPIVSAVGHEIDTSLADLAADLRAPTPSAAAELVVWSRADFLSAVSSKLSRMASSLQFQVKQNREFLYSLVSRPAYRRPLEPALQRQQQLDNQLRILIAAGKNNFEKYANRLSLASSRLEALSPLRVLGRGYSVTRCLSDGRIVRQAADLEPGSKIETILADGKIVSLVEKTEKANNIA